MDKNFACISCRHVGRPKTYTKGSLGMEIVLWLLFIFPGIIYSVWRLTSRYNGCEKCKGASLIPLDTPEGKKIASAT